MKDLTEKEVKQCVRLLGWKRKTDQVTCWYVDEEGKIQWRQWEEGHHRQVSLTDVLFTKLWDRLLILTDAIPVSVARQAKWYAAHVGLQSFTSDHPCLALYEAAEKILKAKELKLNKGAVV